MQVNNSNYREAFRKNERKKVRTRVLMSDSKLMLSNRAKTNTKKQLVKRVSEHNQNVEQSKHFQLHGERTERLIWNAKNANANSRHINQLGLARKLNNLMYFATRKACTTRIRNCCVESGRMRGILSNFAFSRIKVREHAAQGHINGLKKASW